jgi:conjugal transfer pilin signal peptidase TrbI
MSPTPTPTTTPLRLVLAPCIRLAAPREHFDAARFRSRAVTHLRRWGLAYAAALAGAFWFHNHYALGLNATHSLPGTLYLIERGALPQRGEHVAFRWAGGGRYPAGVTFIKVLAGQPGDTVTRDGATYVVAGTALGPAKPTSRRGEPLEPGPTGTLPDGGYFVYAPHPDSLDSRYALTGWIAREQFIGRARAIF